MTTYAGGRRVVDADSHVMEWPGFLTENADPHVRDRLPPIAGGLSGLDITQGAHTDSERARLIELGADLTRLGPKWHAALGGVDGVERSAALDLLGFEHQVV